MSDCVHWWILEASSREGTPSVCRDCGDEKTWPPASYTQLLDGRPFLVKDPLLRRAEHIYRLGDWRY